MRIAISGLLFHGPPKAAGKWPPLEPHRNYHPLSAAGEGTIKKGKQAYANLRALPVGTEVEADFAPRYFREIPGMHEDDGIGSLIQHGTVHTVMALDTNAGQYTTWMTYVSICSQYPTNSLEGNTPHYM